MKQLVQDALPLVLEHDAGAQTEFKKFAERRLKKPTTLDDGEKGRGGPSPGNINLLAELLVSPNPRRTLITNLTEALVSESLQSRDQLLRVAAHFALTKDDVMSSDQTTKDAFEARNQITHEMDIDLQSGKVRRTRNYADMVRLSRNIAKVAQDFISGTAAKIQN